MPAPPRPKHRPKPKSPKVEKPETTMVRPYPFGLPKVEAIGPLAYRARGKPKPPPKVEKPETSTQPLAATVTPPASQPPPPPAPPPAPPPPPKKGGKKGKKRRGMTMAQEKAHVQSVKARREKREMPHKGKKKKG